MPNLNQAHDQLLSMARAGRAIADPPKPTGANQIVHSNVDDALSWHAETLDSLKELVVPSIVAGFEDAGKPAIERRGNSVNSPRPQATAEALAIAGASYLEGVSKTLTAAQVLSDEDVTAAKAAKAENDKKAADDAKAAELAKVESEKTEPAKPEPVVASKVETTNAPVAAKK
jgi:hypothetical protein